MPRKKRVSNETTKIFADRLSDLVEEHKNKGLTQKEIAKKIGCASGTLSEWCSDNKTAGIDSLRKLADYFDVSVSWLIGASNIREKGTEIQEIHYVTGLSSKAIFELKWDKEFENTKYRLDFINKLFESNLFADMAKLADAYCRMRHEGTVHIDMLDVVPFLDEVSLKEDVLIKSILTEYFFRVIEGTTASRTCNIRANPIAEEP